MPSAQIEHRRKKGRGQLCFFSVDLLSTTDYNRGKPVGWWEMDECEGTIIHDISGNNEHGTLSAGDNTGDNDSVGTCGSGATAPANEMWNAGTIGKFGASVDFDGTNDYASLSNPDTDDFSTGPMSVSAWVKTTTTGSYMVLVDNKTAGTNNAGFNLQIGSDDIPYFRIANGSAQTSVSATGVSVNDGLWHHIVGVLERGSSNDTTRIYIDGRLINSNTGVTAGWNISSSQSMYFGSYSTSAGFFNGQLDDVRLYSYALSGEQVKQIMNYGAVRFE